MRKSIKSGILFVLELGGILVSDLIAVTTSPYGSSENYINKKSMETMDLIFGHLPETSGGYKEKNLKNVIYKLKKDGLIDYKDTSEGRSLFLTNKGKSFLKIVKNKGFPYKKYTRDQSSESDKSLKIIIFDIPEKERGKRDWLRDVIKNLGFTKLQQSVWAGNNAIPEDFLSDLEEMKILRFVEIFSVSKKGTIEKINLR
jgi:DNA-binding transcriptional regulator PaaX